MADESNSVKVSTITMGFLANNVYVIGNEGHVVVVDPCDKAPEIVKLIGDAHLDAILLTHGHFDHVGAAVELRELTGAPVIASVHDADNVEAGSTGGDFSIRTQPCTVDRRVDDGDVVETGFGAWQVIATPGHTKGGVCYYLPAAEDRGPILASGDTLFCGTTGRTDFSGGSVDEMRESLRKLAQLPDETKVLPGHNEQTTIGAERSCVFAQWL